MFRFTIRDVLWLTVVVALAVGWLIDRGQLVLSLEQAELRAQNAANDAKWANDLREIARQIEQAKHSK